MKVKATDGLINSLSKLPGIGQRTAQRLTFHLLKHKEQMAELARALDDARKNVTFCTVCGGLTDLEEDPCRICSDPRRNQKTICVVETEDLIDSVERTGFTGVYHVLGGLLSPLDNVGPEDLRIRELQQRIEQNPSDEIILVLSPTSDGDATADCIARALKKTGVRISRIATGLPVGSSPSLADAATLTRAIRGRIRINGLSGSDR